MRRITVLPTHSEDVQDGDALVAKTISFSASTAIDTLASTPGAYNGILAIMLALPVRDPAALADTWEVRSICTRLAPSGASSSNFTRESMDKSRVEPSSYFTINVNFEDVRARPGKASARGSVFAKTLEEDADSDADDTAGRSRAMYGFDVATLMPHISHETRTSSSPL